MKFFRILALCFLGFALDANAQTMNIFVNGQPLDATLLNQNFNRLLNKVHTITGADIQNQTIQANNIADDTITDSQIKPGANIQVSKLSGTVLALWPRAWINVSAVNYAGDAGVNPGASCVVNESVSDGTRSLNVVTCNPSQLGNATVGGANTFLLTIGIVGATQTGVLTCSAGPYEQPDGGFPYTAGACLGTYTVNTIPGQSQVPIYTSVFYTDVAGNLEMTALGASGTNSSGIDCVPQNTAKNVGGATTISCWFYMIGN